MFATFPNQPQPAPRRRYRIGGYRISSDAAAQWASKLAGRELDPMRNSPTIRKVLLEKTVPVGANFRQVGEEVGVHWMLITQGEKFDGYKDMDPAQIPQFKPGERDVRAEKLLQEEDSSSNALGIKEYEFATVLD
ncbi:hypothetical protein M422DRAFT_68615 [Sphaerobolus stellatus SS14]|uniref:Unplaced genomic scaffold SPHSTscaffold_71, whole genome shotgun sequence n=1 Tax=Sphaerobolus stellatus (strain SS14) TaxID=990650 RepID=A0A0C9VQC7_SPHS4|nr:hypothetical protein M422DRAFT_68615 [Sphaerobolus stellatus SS14]